MKNGTVLFFVALLGLPLLTHSITPTAFAGNAFHKPKKVPRVKELYRLKKILDSLDTYIPSFPEVEDELTDRQCILKKSVEQAYSPEGLTAHMKDAHEFAAWLQEQIKNSNKTSTVYSTLQQQRKKMIDYLKECEKYKKTLNSKALNKEQNLQEEFVQKVLQAYTEAHGAMHHYPKSPLTLSKAQNTYTLLKQQIKEQLPGKFERIKEDAISAWEDDHWEGLVEYAEKSVDSSTESYQSNVEYLARTKEKIRKNKKDREEWHKLSEEERKIQEETWRKYISQYLLAEKLYITAEIVDLLQK